MRYLSLLIGYLLIHSIAIPVKAQGEKKYTNVLILGNSITRHGPKPSIGWYGDWGMAASSQDKDYVHLLMAKFHQVDPHITVNFRNIADYERGYQKYDLSSLDDLIRLKPGLIILRLGENVEPTTMNEQDFKKYYNQLIDRLTSQNPTAVVLHAASFWNKPSVNQAIKSVSSARHEEFISLNKLSADSSNMAIGLFKDKGVASHPSDKGMQAIAGAIWAKILELNLPWLKSGQQDGHLPQLGKSDLKEVINALTLDEKAHLVIGVGKKNPVAEAGTEKVPGAAGRTFPVQRLGIPSIILADGPAGVRTDDYKKGDTLKSFYSTGFPVGVSLASTWNSQLVKEVGRAFGSEVHEYGIDIILAPALNIQRNPLGGRNYEYYSEDPLVSGSIAASMVQGLQSNQIGTSIKHFAANNQETNRKFINTIISTRALREIYLRGFQIVLERCQPWTVMSSYNKINGKYTSEDPGLLTTILRKEWGFKGTVMSDWDSGHDVVDQIKAGNDLIMPGKSSQVTEIINAVNQGKLSMDVLNTSVERILNTILLSPSFKQYPYSGKPDLTAHAKISRGASAEGMVLLKNASVLPFSNKKKVALFGFTSYKIVPCGFGSGHFNRSYTISVDEGLKNAGFILDKDLSEKYHNEVKNYNRSIAGSPNYRPHVPEPLLTPELVNDEASENDIGVITIGRNSGEGSDLKTGEFSLQDGEQKLINSVSEAFHAKGKKVLVIMNVGFPMETASWRNKVDGILVSWLPGPEGGNAIADIISGKISPSGKLAVTFPETYSSVPSAKNFPGDDQRKVDSSARVKYEEGIYTGYRYYNSFKIPVAYEFGYGLSYTKFSYSAMQLDQSTFKDSIIATVKITNTGQMSGREIAELYIKAPAVSLDKPSSELKGFSKTKELQPGESETIRFTIKRSDLASFDSSKSSWTADAGSYVVLIGASSRDIRLQQTFTLPKELIVEKVHQVMTPQEPIVDRSNK